jgi:hypothetical protein
VRGGFAQLDRHWAAVESERLPETVRMLADRYWDDLGRRGLLDLWQRSERTYYGTDGTGQWKTSAAVEFSGADLELVQPRIAQYRSIGQGMLAIAGHERPAFLARAVNDSSRSLIEAPKATGVIQAFWKDWGLEERSATDDERAMVYGVGFQHLRWSIHAGKEARDAAGQPVLDEMGRPQKEGDVIAESVGPWRVVHDVTQTDLEWACVAHDESVWDLAARYPAMAEQLTAQRGSANRWPFTVWGSPWTPPDLADDKVTVWCVYHRPTDAVPRGRYAIVCADLVLYDGPAFVDEVPVLPMVASRMVSSGAPYSALWDLLVLQELYDAGMSSVATGHDAAGAGNMLVPEGCDVSDDDLAGSRRAIRYTPNALAPNAKPEAFDTLSLSEQAYRYPELVESLMEKISGLNSVARGEPDSNLKSGAALALVQSLAVQFNSQFQARRVLHRERIATIGYRIIRENMVGPRLALTQGSGSDEYLREVRKEDLEDVESVQIEQGPALLNQQAGRLDIANQLLDRKLVTTPEQYFQILATGRLEPMMKAPLAQVNNIAAENDMLLDGRMPIGTPSTMDPTVTSVRVGQDHASHVREHQALLTSDTDPKIAELIELHCAHHKHVWETMGPELGALTGQSVPPPMPMAPPGAEPPPEGEKAGPGPDGPRPPAPGRAQPLGGPPSQAMPMMPTNPLTGQRAPGGSTSPPQ